MEGRTSDGNWELKVVVVEEICSSMWGQLLLVVGEEGSGKDGHAGPCCRVPSLLVLLGQFNPGLDVDLEVGGGGVVSGVFG